MMQHNMYWTFMWQCHALFALVFIIFFIIQCFWLYCQGNFLLLEPKGRGASFLGPCCCFNTLCETYSTLINICYTRAHSCKRLKRAKASIPPPYVAWRAGNPNRGGVPGRQAGNRFLLSLKGLQIRAPVTPVQYTYEIVGRFVFSPSRKQNCRQWYRKIVKI